MSNEIDEDYIVSGKGDKIYTLTSSGALSLHFEHFDTQSLMLLSEPYQLVLTYTQAMMVFKIFNRKPKDILIVGLGGGSLSKYCYARFPVARITTLEISQAVLNLRDEFHLPADDERFKIVHTDASVFMREEDFSADVILLDGFNSDGLPDDLSSTQFYDDCHRKLNEDGLVVANFLADDPRFYQQVMHFYEAYGGNCIIGYPSGCYNHIIVARKGSRKLIFDTVSERRRISVNLEKNLAIPSFEHLSSIFSRHRH